MQEIVNRFAALRHDLLTQDRRFTSKDGQLCFDGAKLDTLAKKYGTPLYVFSEKEIARNIQEILRAVSVYAKSRVFYAAKACSVLAILRIVKDQGIGVEANSLFELMKAFEAGFTGNEIVFNGVVKTRADLEYAISHDLYLINVDSLYELRLVDQISRELKKTAAVCIRVEPSVQSPTHPGLVTAYHAKAGIDLQDAEEAVRMSLGMPFVRVRGLSMHVGDQIPTTAPFAEAARILVQESKRLEKLFDLNFDVIDVGGGIPVPYKYDTENGNPLKDHMYCPVTSEDFAEAIIQEVKKWRDDVDIILEPGRKIPSSAGVLLTTVCGHKKKTNFDAQGNAEKVVDWRFCDAGFNVMTDAFMYGWFFYLYNASRISEPHDHRVKIAGPLCDGGDYLHVGLIGEEFLLPVITTEGDVLALLDTGAYSIETQSVYNSRPRTAVVLIGKEGKDRVVRRADRYEDLISSERV
jgi:diaminopimelate decarboxylase